mmetsp:Transcript_8869/g.24565  ORF Transcript_8869/g.24565 Transcript_8869/m.24565 type:complete len:290 (+) Transcript_8869:154-1023(+)|eukprot:CAMPEP_0168726246 /NCGR_PEP_ID=MMETSP0724-20121128/4570_1 /TAXON_ID=265536 /ORGANISM="Amphiprora sp., Strain CCMP467" /LENGTH=289 /DNA_ID=CAMNT_0008773055 /DNA_START=70 /DNA_END=939 /DNA_ORIENTATION=-
MSSSSEAEFEDGEEMEEGEYREEPPPTPKEEEEEGPRRRAKRQISYKEDDDLDGKGDYDVDQDDEDEEEDDDDDDDSDDDIPLSQLSGKAKKTKPPAPKNNGTKKKPAASAAKKAKTKATKKAAPAKKAGGKGYDHASDALYGSKCDKGLLVQRLLCRWWYAYDWPENAQKEPPEKYDALDGFPGVFVCTSGDQVGHILDTRDEESRPCFQNFTKKSSAELKQLLLQALDGQERVLQQAQQNGTASADFETVLKELKGMRKWTNKVNANKADKEANKLLKGFKLKNGND